MYYPFFRGKLFELILLRENANFFAENNIHPIIEPVKNDFNALNRTLKTLCEYDVNCTVIINPQTGENPVEIASILRNLNSNCVQSNRVSIGYILSAISNISELTTLLDKYDSSQFSILHYGFTNGKIAADALQKYDNIEEHIFIDGFAGKLYQKHLKKVGVSRVLIRNGFKPQKKNSLYPKSEHFSDLHITYPDELMDGFGDFLIVGDDYTESGGPAYAVAIHLTYLEADDDMYIYHFISDQTDSPTNPGGKFLEALKKMVSAINKPDSLIFNSRACAEFVNLYKLKHYPGLGYIKKLSMQHHLELIADYLKQNN